jgi:hypothetical protein
MSKDLTTSKIDRQNILNNPYAIEEIHVATGISGIIFEGEIKFLKDQLAKFFEVEPRTIDRFIENNSEELSTNGYEVLRCNRLKEFKLALKSGDANDMHVVSVAFQLGVFNFRAFLDLAMLLTESDRAKSLRSVILDIVIDTVNKKTGGGTKYINQRDEDFIVNFLRGEDYRKEFTDALRDYVEMGKAKYPIYTDKIYKSVFKENAQEYWQILKLHDKQNVRETMYAEVLLLISSFEVGFADVLRKEFEKLSRKLTSIEVDSLFTAFESHRHWLPQIEDVRTKMASRDLGFREALHIRVKENINAIPPNDFERFLGEKSKDLSTRLEEMSEEFKRLKERE